MKIYINLIYAFIFVFQSVYLFAQSNPNANPYSIGINSDKGTISVGEVATVTMDLGNNGSDPIPAGGAEWTISFPVSVTVLQGTLNFDGADAYFNESWLVESNGLTYLTLTVVSEIPANLNGGPDVNWNLTVDIIGKEENNTLQMTINNIFDSNISGNVVTNDDNSFGPITVDGVLAVNLIDFTVKRVDLDAYLSWETASEVNNSYFEIERSFDGTEFETIQTIAGQGNASNPSEYIFVDRNIGERTQVAYYRLLDVDHEGYKNYSETKKVAFENDLGLEIKNVDASGRIRVLDHDSKHRITEISVVSVDGKIMNHEIMRSGVDEYQMNLSHLTSGMYIIQVNKILSKKLIVSN